MNQITKYLSAFFLAATLVTAVGCSSTRTQESTGEYTDDVAITAKVKAAINKAIEVTRAVSGVKSVKNDMRIK